MCFRAVHNDRLDAKLLCDAQRGEDIVRAVRMEMRFDLAPKQRQQRFQLGVVVRPVLIRIALGPFAPRQILLGFVKLLSAAVAIRVTGLSSLS